MIHANKGRLMQRNLAKKLILSSFWISMLLHLLIFLSLTTVVLLNTHQEQQQKSPQLFVPSYVYKGSIAPAVQQQNTPKVAANAQQQQASDSGIDAPVQQERAAIVHNTQHTKENVATEKNVSMQKSIMHATREVLKENQRNAFKTAKESDPIYLVGDDTSAADPLIKLLGRSLSAHFEYPRLAGELGIRGRVIIGLTLHPEGYFSDVEIIRSSDNQDLDAAALYAVNSAPTVFGADRFLSQPKHFVIGFLFR